MLRPILVWPDAEASVSWHMLDENCVRPWSLKAAVFANILNKQCRLRFGPTVSQLIQLWRAAELQCKFSCKWHTPMPLFNNSSLLIGERPISHSSWNSRNIHTLKNVYCDTGLCTFQDIKTGIMCQHNLSFHVWSSLQAHSALVQQTLPVQPLHKVLVTWSKNRGTVTVLCHFLTMLVRLP